MYIPRPAKLLFTFDNGWNRYLEKHGDNVSQWTLLSVERMLACGTCVMCARHYCCGSPDCTHSRFFCQSCKSKACSSCGMQATEQWIAEQQHILPDCDWQHITFTMPPHIHLSVTCGGLDIRHDVWRDRSMPWRKSGVVHSPAASQL
ncbi:transposase zinc-binding domain-containing protein [Edwardsiella anguillarum]|nr:transposase zinc-binding domain-containing protein [Edwardsiella anguillarum]